jgi:hypothetical protein
MGGRLAPSDDTNLLFVPPNLSYPYSAVFSPALAPGAALSPPPPLILAAVRMLPSPQCTMSFSLPVHFFLRGLSGKELNHFLQSFSRPSSVEDIMRPSSFSHIRLLESSERELQPAGLAYYEPRPFPTFSMMSSLGCLSLITTRKHPYYLKS